MVWYKMTSCACRSATKDQNASFNKNSVEAEIDQTQTVFTQEKLRRSRTVSRDWLLCVAPAFKSASSRSHWDRPCDPSTSQVKIYVTGSKQTEAKTCASLRSYRRWCTAVVVLFLSCISMHDARPPGLGTLLIRARLQKNIFKMAPGPFVLVSFRH